MPVKPSLKTNYTQGSVKATVSLDNTPFASESVTLRDLGAEYSIRADMRSHLRYLQFFLDKNITPGTYSFGDGPGEIYAYLYYSHGEFGWSYYADSGTLNIAHVDLGQQLLEATFEFEAPGMEQGDPPVKVSKGKIHLTGPRGKTQ
ncbi:hypothetical protein [Pseudomonas brenneri]|uniref:hypothetical protein n=1 Tax=Pseudomonas brenneri TaxID=129817 RepID=UPI0028D4E464|nr:hypothetical protein [Pseudomonas brenneri]|tara:strand:- start:37 stop:474 length:438 start_codon:yes stop_codon:yes gene_type:complete